MAIASELANQPRDPISTIAELIFVNAPVMNFSRLVSDLDGVLLRFHPQERTLLWDCDDVAIFDVPGTRIALAYTDTPRLGVDASLLISVGPPPRHDPDGTARAPVAGVSIRHDLLCSRLVERVQQRLAANSVYWQEVSVPVTADFIDSFSTSQPQTASQAMPHQQPHAQADAQPHAQAGSQRPSDHRNLRDQDLLRLRNALYPYGNDLPPRLTSTQMRLATHAMNATLIAASLPIGAALTTYAVLRGENMRTTTSAMVLTGLAGTLMQGRFAEQLMFLGLI